MAWKFLASFALAGALMMSLMAGAAAAETIVVGGSGSPIPLTQEIAKAFLAKTSGHQIDVLPKSIGEAGGIAALGQGKVQVAVIARAPEPAERRAEMTFRLYARVPAVVAVGQSVTGVSGLTEQQILDIYAGRLTNWKTVGGPDARIRVLTRNESDMNKRAWRAHLKGFRDLAETKEAVILYKAQDMVAALLNQPHAVGLTDTIGVLEGKGRLRALAVNGILPTADNVAGGRYWIVKEFYVGVMAGSSPAARSFADFFFSADSTALIRDFGAVAVR